MGYLQSVKLGNRAYGTAFETVNGGSARSAGLRPASRPARAAKPRYAEGTPMAPPAGTAGLQTGTRAAGPQRFIAAPPDGTPGLERRLQPAQPAPGGRRDGPRPPAWRARRDRRPSGRHAGRRPAGGSLRDDTTGWNTLRCTRRLGIRSARAALRAAHGATSAVTAATPRGRLLQPRQREYPVHRPRQRGEFPLTGSLNADS